MPSAHLSPIAVADWPPPKGYVNGVVASSDCRVLHVAGQIGWKPDGTFPSADLVQQFALALDNVLAVLDAAGGTATDIAAMTIYVTDIAAYRTRLGDIGQVWRARMGRHYPAMALVAVTALVEPAACVEVQAVAHLRPEGVT